MSRRQRPEAEKSLPQQIADAREQIENAKAGLGLLRAQHAEAVADLEALGGIAGVFSMLFGSRAEEQARREARVKQLAAEIQACRQRQIEAQQLLNRLSQREQDQRSARDARDLELEQFAVRVRDSHHPLREELLAVEEEIQAVIDQLDDHDRAFKACSGLAACVGEVDRNAGNARSTIDAQRFRGVTMSSQSVMVLPVGVQAIQTAAEAIPDAIDRFNDECARIGLDPLDLEVAEFRVGITGLFGSALFQPGILLRIEELVEDLRSVRQIAVETSLFVAERRKELLVKQEELMAKRRALLDGALG